MEELRSTEALDQEILEDARKKAERLLRSADQASDAADLSWAKKAEADIAELERKHADRVAGRRKETMARLPLDKRRERAERAERLLRRAMADFLSALPRDRLLSIVARELSSRAGELPSSGLKVSPSGFLPGEVESILSGILPPGSWALAETDPATYVASSHLVPGLTLPSLVVEGGRVLVRVGVEAAAEELLRERRSELVVALLGEEAAND